MIGGEVERAEPDTELHCSPVLRSDVVTTRLREGFLLASPTEDRTAGRLATVRGGGAAASAAPGLRRACLTAYSGATTKGKRDLLPWGQPDQGAPAALALAIADEGAYFHSMKTFAQVLDSADELDVEEQESLVEVLQRPCRRTPPRNSARKAVEKSARREFEGGGCRPATPKQIVTRLLA